VDLFDDARGKNAEIVMPAVDPVGRKRLFAPQAQRALRRMSDFGSDGETCSTGKPGARAREAAPGLLVRRHDIRTHRERHPSV
jgi:hypothetical protein